MRALLLVLLFTVLVSETCAEKKARKKAAIEAATTNNQQCRKNSCLHTGKIDSIKKLPKFNPPAEVTEYSFNEKRVFLFTSDCCDFFNSVYDENCQYVCAPSGALRVREILNVRILQRMQTL
jgi:hypothetical protein